MIDKKEISKASAAHAKATWKSQDRWEQLACMEGFEAGVNWAQEEFKKSLWHDASEEPQAERPILIKKDFIFIRYEAHSFCIGNWKERVKRFSIVSWCYIDDLIPQEGGER